MHDVSLFVTLTFSDDCLPSDLSVNVRDLQLFMKRLRKKYGSNIRFFASGEYGDKLLRPHYHLILFGIDFDDRVPWRKTSSGHVVYRSAKLEALWPFGHCEIGAVTRQSAGYVARYCLKKVNGERAAEVYRRVDAATGETWQVRPEFIVMSRRPGIGGAWFSEFRGDAFPSDYVVVDGLKRSVPRYYKNKLERIEALAVGAKRQKRARKHAANNTDSRLLVRAEATALRVKRLTRALEDES